MKKNMKKPMSPQISSTGLSWFFLQERETRMPKTILKKVHPLIHSHCIGESYAASTALANVGEQSFPSISCANFIDDSFLCRNDDNGLFTLVEQVVNQDVHAALGLCKGRRKGGQEISPREDLGERGQGEEPRPISPIVIWRPTAKIRLAEDVPFELLPAYEPLQVPQEPNHETTKLSTVERVEQRCTKKDDTKKPAIARAEWKLTARGDGASCNRPSEHLGKRLKVKYGAWYLPRSEWKPTAVDRRQVGVARLVAAHVLAREYMFLRLKLVLLKVTSRVLFISNISGWSR
jgi:hypothetical protein